MNSFFTSTQIIIYGWFLKGILGNIYVYHVKFLHSCLVIFLRAIFAKTRNFSNWHTTSRTYKTCFFLRLYAEQTLHPVDVAHLFLSLGGIWTTLCFLSPLSRRSAGSFSCCRLGGGGVGAADIEATDWSSTLSFFSFLSCGSYFINTVKY
jgi:hypothetical protein